MSDKEKQITDIMIVTYNRIELTKKTLNSLLETTKSPFNLILIDNASKDGTSEYLFDFCYANSNKGFFRNFNVTKNNENLGIAVGRNQGLQHSTSEWLCTLDNDVMLPVDWLSQCIDILANNSGIGMMGVNFEKTNYPLVSDGKYTWQNKPRGNLGTACAVFNRSLHKKLGYFNTEYGIYGEEDADFGMRVRVAGFKMGYLKENGTHLGEGENDTGAYREFKTKSHQNNLNKFYKNCDDYVNRRRPIYIDFGGVK